MAFVQGFLAQLTLDSVIITLATADVSFSESKTALDKSVMDSIGVSQSIPGMTSVLSTSTGISIRRT